MTASSDVYVMPSDAVPTLTKAGEQKLQEARDAHIAFGLSLAGKPLTEIVDHLLDVLSDAIDPETGEVSTDFEAYLESLNFALERKVEVYGAVNARLRAEAEAIGELAKTYAKRAQARENQAKRLRLRLQGELERLKIDKVKTPTTTAALQKSAPSVELHVLEVDTIPDEYVITERKPDIKKIADHLKAHGSEPWASLRQSVHLRFR